MNSFTRNSAGRRGGAVYANESVVRLLGNSFDANNANITGSAIFLTDSLLCRNETFVNIFAFNSQELEEIGCSNCRVVFTDGKSPIAQLARFRYAGLGINLDQQLLPYIRTAEHQVTDLSA